MIIVRLSGGMGNQMFQYAFGRALSLRHNVPLGLDLAFLRDRTTGWVTRNFMFRDYDLDAFTIKAEIVSQNKIPFLRRWYFTGTFMWMVDKLRKRLSLRGSERQFHFNQETLTLGPNTYLEGYWQSPRYFEAYAEVIRSDFTLSDHISHQTEQLKEEMQSCNSVSLHVRRGDYIGNALHDIGITQKYYDQALSEISKKTMIDCIYVFSDDIEWCKSHLSFPIKTVFVGDEHAGHKKTGHLVAMSWCKHHVIANSTFSWWGAWLNPSPEKIVIAPKKWFSNDSIDTSDLVPKEWIRL